MGKSHTLLYLSIMPATRKRSRKHQFQSGNQKRTEWTARSAAAAAAATAAAAAAGGHGGDGDGVDSPADFPYNLRDRKPADQSQKSGLGKMRLVHVDKNCDMWNFAIEEHLKLDNCSRPKFQPAKEEKRGVVVAQSLRCVNCSFVTPLFKLYEEIRKPGRGQSAAVQNLELNAAVTSTSIGFKKLRFLLAALDLSPPSESGMHQMSQTVCDKIAQLSSDDMNQKLLQASGLQKNIHISVDTRYNTSGIRNSRRTGLPIATQ
ncbi:hypothetical protein, partial [Thiolapillus sp.]|uniref:hypothetical protein n=2 Tax=Thiolapillus sp. TaxID=2017437 RepID=UPI003AF9085C